MKRICVSLTTVMPVVTGTPPRVARLTPKKPLPLTVICGGLTVRKLVGAIDAICGVVACAVRQGAVARKAVICARS